MNQEKQAAALRKIAEGIYEYADLLFDSPSPVSDGRQEGGAIPPAPPSMPEFPPLEPYRDDDEDLLNAEAALIPGEGSEAQCPKHRKPYKDGKFGPFCTSTTDDQAWGKQRDGTLWCRITPKNAAEWLRMTAAA